MGQRKTKATKALFLAVAGLLLLSGCVSRTPDLGLGGGYQPPLIVDGLVVAKVTTGSPR